MKERSRVNIVNRKSKFEFSVLKTENAGICLLGTEVKAIREGKVGMVDSFCSFESGELWVRGLNISNEGGKFEHDAIRPRKLLLKRRELDRLESDLINGLTIIPYRIFENDKGIFKVEIFLAKGKKLYDKRESIKEREAQRELRTL